MKEIWKGCFYLFLLMLPFCLWGQQEVILGGVHFVPEQNMRLRGGDLSLGKPTNGFYNTLVQFESLPSQEEITALAAAGIRVGSYVGGNAYYALINASTKSIRSLRSSSKSLTSVVPLQKEWKVSPTLKAATLPTYALEGGNVKVVVHYAENVDEAQVRLTLQRMAKGAVRISDIFRTASLTVEREGLEAVSALPWVLSINPVDAPLQLNNSDGGALSRASVLRSASPLLGARRLDGTGIRVGIWDGNVMQHPDFGNRVHQQEYEQQGNGSEQHGTHVAGSVLGSGLLNERAYGMAPRATAYTYNFGGSNGLSAQEEMLEAKKKFGISLTQNSYGTPLTGQCQYYYRLNYRQNDFELDILTNLQPSITHVFAAGNEQAFCSDITTERYGVPGYGTTTWRAKNVIYAGAVNTAGLITNFSSCGPQDDGRMFPTIMSKGEQVLSTQPNASYAPMKGTSMACPIASGTLALIQQRYLQLHNNRPIRNDILKALVINTADDAGRRGPDFQYGYGILNAENAIDCLENGVIISDSLSLGDIKNFKLPIPNGDYTQAKVTLVWNDLPLEKAVDYGESVLVNDLDLVVKGADTYLPWVCNPAKGHVEELATRKIDNLNNVEQVTLLPSEFGQNELAVEVKGKRVVKGKQRFVLAVWFEKSKTTRIIPLSDNEKLVPGEDYTLHVEGVKGTYNIDLSYNDGESYLNLGHVTPREYPAGYNIVLTIPSNAPATTKARFRIVSPNGGIAASPFPITIAPQVQGVRLEANTCASAGMKLLWNKVDGAIEGYDLFLCDGTKESVEKIGSVDKETNEFAITPEILKRAAVPYFAVAVRLAGDKTGLRSQAVRPYASRSLPLSLTSLPFKEEFRAYPSPYFHETKGKNLFSIYKPYTPEATPGANSLVLVAQKVKDYFNEDEYFAAGNAPQIFTLEMCDLDLSEIPPSEFVYLHVDGRIGVGNVDYPKSARFRAVIDGEPAIPVGAKEVEQVSTFGAEEWIYKITGGAHHNVKLQFVGSIKDDNFTLSGVTIAHPSAKADLILSLEKYFGRGESPKETECKVLVENRSSVPLKDVGLRVLVNGKWVASRVIPELTEMGTTVVPITLDLSVSDPLGAILDIQVIADLEDDPTPENNVLELKYNNRGQVLTMAESELVRTALGKAPEDPKKTVVISRPVIFTDCGGIFGNYSEYQEATMKIVPSDPTQRLRVTFKKLDLVGSNTGLYVYTSSVPKDLKLYSVPVKELLTGATKAPISFTSEATDGALTFLFNCLYDLGTGWVAEIDFVPRANPLAITWASAQSISKEETVAIPVKVKLLNRWKTPSKNVKLSLWNGREVLQEASIAELAAGETDFEFPEKLKLKARELQALGVFLEGDDYEWKDNHYDILAGSDAYCIPSFYKRFAEQWFKELTFENRTIKFKATRDHIHYTLDSVLALYKADGKISAKVMTNNQVPAEQTILLFVDWNEDGSFDTDERIPIAAKPDDDIHSFEIGAPATASAGKKRARLMLVRTDEVAQYPCGTENVTEADIHDFTIELHDGGNPAHNDLELVSINAGRSGKNLSAAQELSIVVRNLSNAEYAAKVKMHISIDGGAETVEEYDFSAQPLAKYSGERKITLVTKANFSALGKHSVKVRIEERPTVVNDKNNELEALVWCSIPSTDGFYALHSQSNTPEFKGEYLDLSAVGNRINVAYDFTLEFWVNLDHPQQGQLFSAEQFTVFTLYQMSEQYPDNALAFVLGAGQHSLLAYTKENSFLPKQWNHVAIVVSDVDATAPSSKLEVYINGQRAPLTREGAGAPTLRSLRFVNRLNGQLDGLRIWNKARNSAEIAANQFVSLRKNNGELPDGLEAEFLFDEGNGNAATFSGADHASIGIRDTERFYTSNANTVWKENKQLFDPLRDCRFTQQANIEKTGVENHYRVAFIKGSAKVQSVKLRSSWPNVVFSYEQTPGNWQPVTATTTLDFNTPVKLKATLTLFGKALEQVVSYEWTEDKSNANQITKITLSKAQNAGLNNDLVFTDVKETQVIEIPRGETLAKPEEVKLKIAIDEGAKLRFKGAEVTTEEITVDLRTPISFVVIAENGYDTRLYTLRLAMEQSIVWNLATTGYMYGDAPIAHQATADGGVVTFESTDPSVVSVAGANIVFSKPGSATLTPIQNGGGLYKAARGESKLFTVKKHAAKCFPNVSSANYAEPITWSFRYEGLVEETDALAFASPLSYYEIRNANGDLIEADARFAIGHYTLTPKTNSKFGNAYYDVTLQAGEFDVVQGKQIDVTIAVTNEQSEAVANAAIKIANKVYKTDATGTVTLPLPEGEKFSYSVACAGYSQYTGELLVMANSPRISVVLRKATITLTYKVQGANEGAIVGNSTQHLAKGENALPVAAVAREGYVFVKWSDEKVDNPRTDGNVQADAEYTAQFRKRGYTVEYDLSEGGRWKSGDAIQEVQEGGNSSEIEVEPEEGYFFSWWSDYVRTPRRHETDVQDNFYEVAYFDPFGSVPSANSFEKGVLGRDGSGWNSDNGDEDNEGTCSWEISAKEPRPGYALDGACALLNGFDLTDQTSLKISHLVSTRYLLGDNTNELELKFDYIYKSSADSKFTWAYTLDGKTWVNGAELPDASNKQEIRYTFAPAALAGKKFIQFRWTYEAKASALVMVDNFLIAPKNPAQPVLKFVAQPAEGGKFLKGTQEVTQYAIPYASIPENVTAVANDGFLFDGWTDGTRKARRVFTEPVMKDQTYTALFRRNDLFRLSYRAIEAEGGHIEMEGKPVTEQLVEKGHDALAVVAVPAVGYRFLRWNDDGSTNTLKEMKNVQADAKIEAIFVRTGYEVTFRILGNGETVKDAKIAIDGKFLESDAMGMAVCALTMGKYAFTVTAEGYETKERELEVGTQNLYIDVELTSSTITKRYPLHVVVVSDKGETPVEGAKLTIAKEERVSDAGGVITLFLLDGTYAYTVQKEGYKEATGNVTIAGSEQRIKVVLSTITKEPEGITENVWADLVVTPNPFDNQLRLSKYDVKDGHYELLNAQGVVVRTGALGNHETLLNTSELPSGMYLVRVTAKNGATKVVKVVKE